LNSGVNSTRRYAYIYVLFKALIQLSKKGKYFGSPAIRLFKGQLSPSNCITSQWKRIIAYKIALKALCIVSIGR